MIKNEKTKKGLIIAAIVFAVVWLILLLAVLSGTSGDRIKDFFLNTLGVLTPVAVGAAIAYLLNPIVRFFENRILKKVKKPHLKRFLSILFTYIIVLVILVSFLSIVAMQLVDSIQVFVGNIDNYTSALRAALTSVFDDINNYIKNNPDVGQFLKDMGIYDLIGHAVKPETEAPEESVEPSLPGEAATDENGVPIAPSETGGETDDPISEGAAETESGPALDSESPESGSVTDPDANGQPAEDEEMVLSLDALFNFILSKLSTLSTFFASLAGKLSSSLVTFGISLVGFLADAVVSIFISIYFLAAKERVCAQFKKIFTALLPEKANSAVTRILKLSDRTVGRYLINTIVDSTLVGIIAFILLSIFKINYALIIAVIIGITNMIPFFGPFIGAVPSALLVLLDDITNIVNFPDEPHRFKVITFVIIVLVIQQIDGNIIMPSLHGQTLGLSSLGVIVAITVMSGYFGFVGMLLGVPIAAVVVTICKEVLDVILAKKGRPIKLSAYYSPNSNMPPEEEEVAGEAVKSHTKFYEWSKRTWNKVRHFCHHLLYYNHGENRMLRAWVSLKLGTRKLKRSSRDALHHLTHHTHSLPEKTETSSGEEEKKPEETASEDTSAPTNTEKDSDNKS